MDASSVPKLRRRVIPRTLFAVYRQVDRVAPGLTELLQRIVERILRFQRRIREARTEVVTLRAGDARFQLCVVGGSTLAHEDYLPLAASGESYEPVALACLTRVLSGLTDPVFMDIGAFMGYFTCYYAALFGDQWPVWAVESNPVYCDAIRQAIALNGFRRARVLQAALSDRAETVAVTATTVQVSNHAGPAAQNVHAVTLDDLCAREKIAPTVVKIDVHGAEGKVLRGMSRLLQESIQVVLLELHTMSVYKPHSPGVTRIELLDWLEQLGFSLYHVSGHRQEHRTDAAVYLEQGRFAYVTLNAAIRQYLLFDRESDILILATRAGDIAKLLGPPVDLLTAVG